MIGRSGKRGSGISVLVAQDDDDIYIYIYILWFMEDSTSKSALCKWFFKWWRNMMMMMMMMTVHKIVCDDLVFSKVICCLVKPQLCNFSCCSKNSGNHWSVWLRTAATFSLLSRSGSLWFPLVWLPQRSSVWKKVLKRWRENEREQMAWNSVQRFLCWRNTKYCLSTGKNVF